MTKKKRLLVATVILTALVLMLVGIFAIAAGEPTAEIKLHNLSMRQNVVVKYAVEVENLPSGATVGVEVQRIGKFSEATFSEIAEIDGKEYYIFDVDDLSAAEMTTDLYARPYIEKAGGQRIYGAPKKSSILEYAYKILGKIPGGKESSDSVKNLLRAMLEYGAAVQRYTGQNLDRLADAEYYQIKVNDGVLSNGDASGLYLSGDFIGLVADEKEEQEFVGWENSLGTVVSTSKNYTLTVGTKNETYTAVYEKIENNISYTLNGGTLPSGKWNRYTPGTKFDLPIPTRSGYVFSGWFTTSDFNISNIISEIPATATAEYTLYAKWNKVIDDLDASGLKNSATTTGSPSMTVSGDKLVWSQSSSATSELLRYGNLPSKLDGEKSFTINLTLSKVAGYSLPSASFRLRRGALSGESSVPNRYITFMSTDASGNVYIGGNVAKIATLTETPQKLSFVFDFENGNIIAYDGSGTEINRIALELPSGDTVSLNEWLNALTSQLWRIYMSSGSGKIAISGISVHAGNSAIRNDGRDALQSEINALKATNNSFTKAQFDTTTSTLTVNSSLSMPSPKSEWGTGYKSYTPIARENGTGARLMLNSSIIEDVLNNSFTNPDYKSALSKLKAIADSECTGILPAATEHTSGRKGIHNYDGTVLGTIEAKAFMYRIMFEQDFAEGSVEALERDKYGYEAIVAIKNYLKTLDIQYITSDQCREYGYVMFIAAEVYDWCYPLLTDADKQQIIFGVVESCCSGTCGKPSYTSTATYKQKMEVGFPPSGQGSVSGHGSEAQVLRDYLSFALAIYDEDPSWYNYVGARIVGDYAAVRSVYFQSGMTQQGICTYVAHRHFFDLYSGWIMETATGKNPYVGMERTLVSIINYALPDDRVFPDGDGASKKINDYAKHTLLSSALYSDAEYSDTLFSWFAKYNGLTSMSTGAQGGVTYPTFFIMASRGQKVVDVYEGLDPISYNGSPLGQMISRNEWNDPDTVAVFMKLKERHTANHEHDDAGTFQIYYKTLLTGDSGVYDSYGNTHHSKYHKATVAHNGLLIADPAKLSSTYSGSQRQPGEASNLSAWQSSTYDTGTVTGVQYGYKDADKTKAAYAYLAGDITKAYDSSQASYVGRRMLTVYTEDENYPMYFFVFDKITSTASYKKTFLLHVRGKNEPTVNGNVITITNGDGKLVAHSLSSNATIEKVGGRVYKSDGSYDADKSMNYLINGTNCKSPNGKDDGHWGRIEITTSGNATSTFMNAMYVTDASGTAKAPTVAKITGSGIEGASIGNVAAVFATSNSRAASQLKFSTSGSGNMTYYVSGVAAGEWAISVSGTSYGTATATEEGGLLVFTAPAGSVTLSSEYDQAISSKEIFSEDYSTTTLDNPTAAVTVNGIKYSNSDMSVCKFSTVKDAAGNYLLVSTTNGAQMQYVANLYETLGGETSVSYVVSLAKVSGKTPLNISFRLRDAKSGNNYNQVFSVDTSGNLKLGGTTTVAQLTTELVEYRFVADFKTGKLYYYADDGSVSSVPMALKSGAANTMEWLTYLTGRYFDCQAYQGNGAIKIGKIAMYKGNIFD